MDYQVRILLDNLISSGKLNQSDVDKLKLDALAKGVDVIEMLLEREILSEKDVLESKSKMCLFCSLFAWQRSQLSTDLLVLSK